jgi:farnesyl-diphosphate farnesyltransferase
MPQTARPTNLAPPNREEVRFLIGDVLRRVSRSFYLTLRILPAPLHEPVGLAYLMARAADTIADTEVMGLDERLENLVRFRSLFHRDPDALRIRTIRDALLETTQHPAEQTLLENIDRCFGMLVSLPPADRARIGDLLEILTTGMEKDLRRFPGRTAAELRHLETSEELDEYTYLVAGCVGPFWTQMAHAHLPSLAAWDVEKYSEIGVRFGKALQLTNILRDIPRDLRIGRCYLPASELAESGLRPADLLEPANSERARPVLARWLDLALDHYKAAWEYTMSIPKRECRLRLACIWPIWIGLETLGLLRRSKNFLDPELVIKISRGRIYAIMAASVLIAGSDACLTRGFRRRWHRAC